MPNTATRLIHLILLLQGRPGQKAAALAAELGVSVRTLHRYFTMLDEMGIPVYSERGPYGGFSLVRGYKLPPLVFTPEEAVAVSLGAGLVEEIWGALYREAGRAALAKLENVLPDEQRHEIAWARRSLVATGTRRPTLAGLDAALEKLRRAARERRRVRLSYRSQSAPAPQEREIDPYALVYRWGWWYAVGYCHLRQGVRTFRLDRIESATLLDTPFERPLDFDLQAYLQQELRSQRYITARLRFLPEAAQVALANRASWATCETLADGAVTVTFEAPDLAWAASSVLAYGPLVEALEPPELRRLVGEWAQAIAERYLAEQDIAQQPQPDSKSEATHE